MSCRDNCFFKLPFLQVPGGRVAEVHGTKRVYGAALLTNGIISFMLPLAAKGHWTLLLLMRALQGLAQVTYRAETSRPFLI